MGGKIDCYLDLASLYSYLTFLELQRNRELLASHNVEVEFHPVLLGAINQGSGNRPPWALPAKAVYGRFDARRSVERHARRAPLPFSTPQDLMVAGKTMVPLRALHYIKQHHAPQKFLTTLHYLLHVFWSPPNPDLTTLPAVAKALAEVPAGFAGAGSASDGKKLFTAEEVAEIVAAAGGEEMKAELKRVTAEALEQGAFGAPWLWVTSEKGKAEPFFGSDRFHFVYEFLGLPYTDVTLLPAGATKGKL